MVCSKPYTVIIASGVVFTWDTVAMLPAPGGAATFTPAELATGNAAVMFVEVPPAGFDASSGDAIARMTWNSLVAVPCNMQIVLSTTGAVFVPDATWALTVDNGGNLVTESESTLGLSGTFDVPFSLPATAGLDVIIVWTIQSFLQPLAGGGSLTVAATFSVL